MRRIATLFIASALALPLVAGAMPTFPLTLSGRVDIGTTLIPVRFSMQLEANGTLTTMGLPGTWTYDAATQTITVDVAGGVVTATGVRTGRCFDGTSTSPLIPSTAGQWRGCASP